MLNAAIIRLDQLPISAVANDNMKRRRLTTIAEIRIV
jgi:hypothetical protein